MAKAAAKTKGKAGRISRYDPVRYPVIARMLKSSGRTNEDIAAALGVSRMSIHNWERAHPEFAEALKSGLLEANSQIFDSLYRRALGYEIEEVRTTVRKLPDGSQETRVEKIRKPVHADTTAIIFWLKNLCPEKFRDVSDLRHSGGVDLREDADAQNIKEILKSDPEARDAVKEAFRKLYPGPSKTAH